MQPWRHFNKKFNEMTIYELGDEISARQQAIYDILRNMKYADYGAYGQDWNEVSQYRHEIEMLWDYRRKTLA